MAKGLSSIILKILLDFEIEKAYNITLECSFIIIYSYALNYLYLSL